MGPGSCRLQLQLLPCGSDQEAPRFKACPAAPCGAPPGSPLLGSTGCVLVPEEWVIPPRHGPLALPQEELLLGVEDVEVIVEVESFGPEHQCAATAMVASVLLSVFLTAYEHFFANMYLTWMAIHVGQFARNLLLLLGTASGSCSSSTRFRASSFFSSRRSVRFNFL